MSNNTNKSEQPTPNACNLIIEANHTRYRTEDLQAIVEFCASITGTQNESKIQFFEFNPKPKDDKCWRFVSKYGSNPPLEGSLTGGSPNSKYYQLQCEFVRKDKKNPAIIKLAAPECWLTPLETLVLISDTDELPVRMPYMGVALLADFLRAIWGDKGDTTRQLDIPLRVDLKQTKPAKSNSVYSELRANYTRRLAAARHDAFLVMLGIKYMAREQTKLELKYQELKLKEAFITDPNLKDCHITQANLELQRENLTLITQLSSSLLEEFEALCK
jgi:hypothetical protein